MSEKWFTPYNNPFPVSHTGEGIAAPSSDIYVQIDTEEFAQKLGATIKQLRVAARRAAAKTRNWLQTQLLRELADAVGVPKKPLRLRYRRGKKQAAFSEATSHAILWIGTNPLEAQKAGKARQTRKGSRAGRHFFEKAFVANVYGPGEKIWRRKGASRFPVVKMTIPLHGEMEEILPRYERPAAEKFQQYFEHELKFAMGWFD